MLLVMAKVETNPGEEKEFLGRLNTYIDIVLSKEPGTLFFDVYKKASGEDEGHFVILEGYENEEAFNKHQSTDYKPGHIAKIREHIANASGDQFLKKG